MSWQLLGAVAVGYEWVVLPTVISGDVAIKVEHSYSYATFPGKAYLLLSATNERGERALYHRSYPYGDEADIFLYDVPGPLIAVGFGARYINVKHNLYARFQSDANWQASIFVWVDD